MKYEEKEIDRLTRRLMDEVTEVPSFSLNSRIMERIRRDRVAMRRTAVSHQPSWKGIMGTIMVGCLLVALPLFQSLGMLSSGGESSLLAELMPYFPLFLTVAGSLSLLFLVSQLDQHLRERAKRKKTGN